MENLRLLQLGSNHLLVLDDDLFVNTPLLTNITLSQNKFTDFTQNTFTPVESKLEYIDISDNPIQCSCQMKWLLNWRKSSLKIARRDLTICSFASMTPFRGKLLFKINPQKLCTSYMNLYCTLPFVALGLFGIFSVVYNKRWSIKYKVYLLKSAIFGYKNIHNPPDRAVYEFDVSIFFVDGDKQWAEDYLRPNMQENLPHFDRIAFGDDDLPLGMYYLDAVLYLIKHSFKTVLLLSRAATRDQEFMMKLRTALNHVTNTRTQCTMLVLLEEIEDEEMPHIVKLYLSEERSHIRWVEDVRAQKYLWKKLENHLIANLPLDVKPE